MQYLVATDGQHTSETVLPYLQSRLEPGDTVHVVQSFTGRGKDARFGDDSERFVESQEMLDSVANRLRSVADVQTHQLVRGNDPHEDVLAFADDHGVDVIVIGIRQRSAAGRAVFGSTAEKILRETDVPVVALPLSRE